MVGITGSVHCLLMCGPLACATLPLAPAAERRSAIAGYQAARVASYTLVGGVFGALGGGVANMLAVSTRPYLTWIMALALLASAFELGKRLRPLPGISQLFRLIGRNGAKLSFTARAAAMGASTPLLPCGLLYGVLAAALTASSFVSGALITFAFSLGGLPALIGAQFGSGLLKWDKPIFSILFRRVLPLAGAAVLIWRALHVGNSCH